AELLVAESALPGGALSMRQEQESLRILHRQHSPHDGVDKAEDGCVRSDTERERKGHGRREARALAQDPEGVAYVLDEGFDQFYTVRLAAFFFRLFVPAQHQPGLALSLFPADAGAHKLVHLPLEMESQFFVELGVDCLALEKGTDSIEQIV